MGERLMDVFEKYSFQNTVSASDREGYFTPMDDEIIEDTDLDIDFEDDDFVDDFEDVIAGEGALPENLYEESALLLEVQGLNKFYRQGGRGIHILNNVALKLYSGEINALVGPSGSGKSTLLHILGLLDTSTSGQIIMGGRDIAQLSDHDRTKLRAEHVGFIYQFHHLLPEFSALENVAMPQIIIGEPIKQAKEKAAHLLEQLGLAKRLEHRPATLSGGEQQRVAIARALINDPFLLFADEPTGNLDPETSEEVFNILLDLARNRGIGALIATHNIELAHQMDRILEVKSGRVLPY